MITCLAGVITAAILRMPIPAARLTLYPASGEATRIAGSCVSFRPHRGKVLRRLWESSDDESASRASAFRQCSWLRENKRARQAIRLCEAYTSRGGWLCIQTR